MQDSTIFDIPKNTNENNTKYIKRAVNDPSVKDDGVYDIDEDCLLSISNKSNGINNIVLIMLIKLFILR